MPHHMLIRVSERALEHVHSHPRRLTATLGVLLVFSFCLLSFGFLNTLHVAHQGRVDNCIAVNELSRKIYVTLYDLGVPRYQRMKFLPTRNCEKVP